MIKWKIITYKITNLFLQTTGN